MTEVKWHPRIYDRIQGQVGFILFQYERSETILRDEILEYIDVSKYPSIIGLRRAVTQAILKQGYVRKLPMNTRKVEFLRQDLENGAQKGHELRIKTYKQQYPALAPAIAEVLKAARYPMWISANKLIADLDDMGIPARTRSMKTIITYLMPELGYDLKRNPDGRLQQQNKVLRTYYRMEEK